MMNQKPGIFFLFLLFIVNSFSSIAQPNERYNAAEIQQAIKKLNVLGSVLYIAAHPDDENTRLITYFTKDKLYNTGYLSLTRGDGGQNLIGSELNEQLGVIRTQELQEARRTDGGKQFFSRAKDFGFSKNPDETFMIWDREKVFADMVWVIRKFRPDVLITRFNTEPGKTHGHHTASAILAAEAFEAAGDPTKFPEQLKYVQVWQPKRLLWNTNWWFYGSEKDFKTEGLLKIDVGTFNPTLGQSYTEIAAASRSMHKSQGFGTSGTRGTAIEYLQHTKGPKPNADIFEDIDVSWNRIQGGAKIGELLNKIYSGFNTTNPSASVTPLLEVRTLIKALPDSYWKDIKLQEIEDVIKTCLGLWTEVIASDYSAVPGQEIKANVELINRSSIPVEIKKISFSVNKDSSFTSSLKDNVPLTFSTQIKVPSNMPYSQPYWLVHRGSKGMFDVNDQQLIGKPENDPAIETTFDFVINGQSIRYSTPVVYKKADPAKGEQYRPLEIIPPLFVNLSERLLVFGDNTPKELEVRLKSGIDHISGKLMIEIPKGWKAEPSVQDFSIKGKGNEDGYKFKVFPSGEAMIGTLKVFAVSGNDTLQNGNINIKYDHIKPQLLLPESNAKIVKLDLKISGKNIGYLQGAGDDIPGALSQIGYKVTVLKEDAITQTLLSSFDAIVIGIRAYNTREKLRYINPLLLNYVKNGGTLVVQYNTMPSRFGDGRMVTDSIGPYPFKLSNDRVTMEDAPVKFLIPEHPVLNTPNKITDKDFENWVQERGLYFPNEWSKEYQALLSCHDIGETPKDGGLLYTKFGKGTYIYTSYSWFRQLPAGVPGAYRIFVNLLSSGNEGKKKKNGK
ncbi:PIG-L family deacetylase [Sporocytophaga sp.]|uniref:PIG-L family deacetylase n=1 Tax=Sporocytophaga sp. TaxID=2231183 RepID=UPI0025F9B034|nr:PIG-L family deacetylase [Sporocytophaga sp.]